MVNYSCQTVLSVRCEQPKYKDLRIGMAKAAGVKIDEVMVTKERPKEGIASTSFDYGEPSLPS